MHIWMLRQEILLNSIWYAFCYNIVLVSQTAFKKTQENLDQIYL